MWGHRICGKRYIRHNPFCMHELTDAYDYLGLLWLTEMRDFAPWDSRGITRTQNHDLCTIGWADATWEPWILTIDIFIPLLASHRQSTNTQLKYPNSLSFVCFILFSSYYSLSLAYCFSCFFSLYHALHIWCLLLLFLTIETPWLHWFPCLTIPLPR